MEDSFLSDMDDEDADEEPEMVESEVVETNDSSDSLITPVDEFDKIKQTYDRFEQIKVELLNKDDRESAGGSTFITKSGWRKIATAFNISVETTEEFREENNGVVQWRVKAKATAPNGVSATGVGMTASNESNFMEALTDNTDWSRSKVAENYPSFPEERILLVDGLYRGLRRPEEVNEHDMFATAATRAKNRAISDLVGGGEVSAEELGAEDYIG